MRKIIFLFIISAFSISLTSCEKVFLGKEEVNDPENNFEVLWTDFDEHYSLFGVRGWNWDSIYSVYRPQVNAQTTNTELWNICRDMINYLDDSHTFIYSPTEEYLVNGEGENFLTSGSDLDSIIEQEFSLSLVKETYIENFQDFSESENDVYFSAKIKNKDIGYIYFNDIGTGNLGLIDDLLNAPGQHKAIIIDIRHNGGGSDVTAQFFASRFSDNEDLIFTVQERNGPEHDDFSDKIPNYSLKAGGNHFSKPVIVLTDDFTVSGAEIFLWYMKSYDKVTHMGTNTSGDFSDTSMRRFLPNGWQYQYSIMMFLSPDGKSLDGKGHDPDVYIRNSKTDIQAGNDLVIEKAVQYLFDTYGIE